MDESPVQRATRIHDLSLSRQNSLHQTDLIYRDEDLRRVKLRLLALEDENAILRQDLIQRDSQNQKLVRQNDLLSGDLRSKQESCRVQQAKINKQAADMEKLESEVASLGSSMQNSGRTMQEKLSLAKELDCLRPEFEKLQSQLAHHKAVVAEKHDLQRQLDSMEVELEQEKRARNKMHEKETKSLVDELRSRAEKAEKQLLSEKADQERLKRQHESELAEARGQQERLEERISTMKLKLKGIQAEFKETKIELERCQTALAKSQRSREKSLKTTDPNHLLGRKRRVDESSLGEITIETPGNENTSEKRQGKKRGTGKTTLGEKSVFSITPFLNRSKDESEEYPDIDETVCPVHEDPIPLAIATQDEDSSIPTQGNAEKGTNMIDAPVPRTTLTGPAETQKPRGRPKTKPLGEAATSKRNLASVAEHDAETGDSPQAVLSSMANQENMASAKPKTTGPKSRPLEKLKKTSHATSVMGESKKRRRKLLGGNGTIMEEDDGEADGPVQPAQKAQLGQIRKRAPLGGVKNAFAGSSFSPLKRDRRGVQASFLA